MIDKIYVIAFGATRYVGGGAVKAIKPADLAAQRPEFCNPFPESCNTGKPPGTELCRIKWDILGHPGITFPIFA